MAPNTVPFPESLRQVICLVRHWQWYKPCALRETVKRLSARSVNPIDNKPPGAVFTKPSNLWPCGSMDRPLVLSYSFFRPANNIIQHSRESKIQTVMKHIEEQVPGVKFNLVDNNSDAVIRISFKHEHPYGKTWSRVGREAERVSFNEPTMNFSGDIQNDSMEYSAIMHELFHALGMLHEHQHPERKFATAVISDIGNDPWSGGINNDIVWHIPSPIAHSRPDAICMTHRIHDELDGLEVRKKDKPYDLDFAWLNLAYPPPDPTKFEQALSVMDSHISKEKRNAILKLYLDGEWDRVRSRILNVSNPKSKSSK